MLEFLKAFSRRRSIDMGDVECWVHTKAWLPSDRSSDQDEVYRGDVKTHAVARGEDYTDRQIAANMAGQIGAGHGAGAFDYLGTIRKIKRDRNE
jgi:hypothetical protein